MGTTIPTKFNGVPKLTPVKVDTITQWYHSALGDADKAGDMDDAYYYEGLVSGLESTLNLLYEVATEAVKMETRKGNLKRAILITGAVAVGYIYFKNKTKVHVFVEAKKTVVTDGIHKMDESFKAKDKKTGFDRLKKSEDKIVPEGYKRVDLKDDKIGDPTDD